MPTEDSVIDRTGGLPHARGTGWTDMFRRCVYSFGFHSFRSRVFGSRLILNASRKVYIRTYYARARVEWNEAADEPICRRRVYVRGVR